MAARKDLARKARAESRRVSRLLVVSPRAGRMTPEVRAELEKAFADHHIVDFDPAQDLSGIVTPRARIVIAAGDGTIEFLVRMFAETRHPVGIVSLGTFNNLALSLGLPARLSDAIDVARHGRPRPITLGRVNGRVFVEACAIGLFGETIALGESAKDREFGALPGLLRDVISAPRFEYELSGDLEGGGSAMSLVFSNAASIGGRLPISDASPTSAHLEFSVHAGRTRTDIVGRALASALLMKHAEEGSGQVFRFNRLRVKTKPRVPLYADNMRVGRTPATVTAETSALTVLLPG
jgi:diacylglycerol kinase (ATP)